MVHVSYRDSTRCVSWMQSSCGEKLSSQLNNTEKIVPSHSMSLHFLQNNQMTVQKKLPTNFMNGYQNPGHQMTKRMLRYRDDLSAGRNGTFLFTRSLNSL